MNGTRIRMARCLSLLAGILLLAAGGAVAGELVAYDRTNDRLTIQAEQASLRTILAGVSLESGVEILLAADAERVITVRFEGEPLEAGLRRIARASRLSHFMVYGEGEERDLLLRMKLFPSGQSPERAALTPAASIGQEAIARSRPVPVAGAAPTERDAPADLVDRRWRSRLDELPGEARQKLESLVEQLEKKRTERAERAEERQAKHEERRDAHRAREEARRAADPEGYERLEQRRQAYLEQLGRE